MTEEEKKAIEVLENIEADKKDNYTNHRIFCKKCVFKDDEHSGCYDENGEDCQVSAVKTLLNLIQKQQNEIEKKEQLYNKALNGLVKADKENLKKDKMIGKMIDNIMTHYQVKTIRKMCCPACKIGERACTYSGIHRNCIKQYFERETEDKQC